MSPLGINPAGINPVGGFGAARHEAALLVSVDELRAVHRLTGLCLPRFVVADDEEEPRVDAAAVRGLAARELVVLDPDGSGDEGEVVGVRIADPPAALLAPCRAARRIIEIDLETTGTVQRHAVIVDATGTAVVATELPGGLVRLRFAVDGVAGEVSRLCRFDQITGPAFGAGFTVCAQAHRRADELALGDTAPAAVEVLTGAGVPEPVATAWIAAVRGRRCAVGVVVARNRGDGPDGPFELGEVRWLVSADGAAWQVSAADPAEPEPEPEPGESDLAEPDGDGPSDDAPDVLSVLTPVTGEELRAALELIGAGAC